MHKGPFGGHRNGDGQHALEGTSEPVEARIGAEDDIDPPVSDALWGDDRGRPGQPRWLDARDGHEPIVTSI